jgi:hypothetical protein
MLILNRRESRSGVRCAGAGTESEDESLLLAVLKLIVPYGIAWCTS